MDWDLRQSGGKSEAGSNWGVVAMMMVGLAIVAAAVAFFYYRHTH